MLHSRYDYHRTCEKLLAVLGNQRLLEDLGPRDFKVLRRNFGETWPPRRRA